MARAAAVVEDAATLWSQSLCRGCWLRRGLKAKPAEVSERGGAKDVLWLVREKMLLKRECVD